MVDTRTRTQTITIVAGDIRKVVQCTVEEVHIMKQHYGHGPLEGKAKLERDIGLIFLNEYATAIDVELYDPTTWTKVIAYSYMPKADPNAKHHEPGSFKKFKPVPGLSFRIVANVNPQKPRAEVDTFFMQIGWTWVKPLNESGRGKTERDGGFRSGGFTAERCVYWDLGGADDDTQNNGGGYLR